MKTVEVNASTSYTVKIGSGLLNSIGTHVTTLEKVRKVCIVSDTNVWPLYGSIVEKSLQGAGLEVCSFVFPAGEASKNGVTYLNLLNQLAESRLTRSDLIVALGGGVVGDLAGFAAATYLRGIRFVQVPTTLLAAVDSSVGGKTAIDLPAGKNLAGAFCQPSLVLCDTDCLNTLCADIFRDGCAEIIKVAILFDRPLFDQLMVSGMDFNREDIIARCVAHKRDVVIADEFDTGLRQKLNLGHTIGHSVESLSRFSLSHGKAVSIGTAIVARAATKLGICSEATQEQILSILRLFGLPISTEFSAKILAEPAMSDKKRSGAAVNLIIPEDIGHCTIRPTPVSELESFIQAGL